MVSLKNFMGKFVECISSSACGDETTNEKREQSLTKSQRRKQKKKEKKKKQKQQNAEVIKNQDKATADSPVTQQEETYTEYENTHETHFTRSKTQPRERCDSTRSEQSEYESRRDGGWYHPSAIPPNPGYYEHLRRCGSVPANIYRQTGPPDFGQTRKWSSVPSSINVTGVAAGSVDTSYASGIANGHQGNVVVQVHPLDGQSGSGHSGKNENNTTNNHLKTSTISDESSDHKTLTRSMSVSYYQNVIESTLDTLAKLLILFVVLPTFGYLAINEWARDTPQLIFGILLTTIIIARYIGGSKPTQIV